MNEHKLTAVVFLIIWLCFSICTVGGCIFSYTFHGFLGFLGAAAWPCCCCGTTSSLRNLDLVKMNSSCLKHWLRTCVFGSCWSEPPLRKSCAVLQWDPDKNVLKPEYKRFSTSEIQL